MPIMISATAEGTDYGNPFVGRIDNVAHVKADISALTSREVDSKGYLKPGVVFNIDTGLLPGDTVGVKQVETATVVGTIGAAGAGNATVIVTGALLPGGSKTISVAVANNDTASQVAAKIRTALAADGDVNDAYAVSGTGANVVLTALNAAADDATLNVSIDDGTSDGLTAAPTSADTTAGVAPASAGEPVGVVPEASKIHTDNTTLAAVTLDKFVVVGVAGTLNRDIMEDNLGGALSAKEITALKGSNLTLLPT